MTKVRHVFVFPEEKDLVIAGDVEPYDQIDPRRPIGLKTGRPVLQLDDLVTLLRTVGPGNARNAFGCSIDPAADAMKRVEDIIKDKDNKKLPKDKKTEMMIESVGPHTVRYIGQEPDTRVAYVCVEADYLLKRLAMGVDKSPVAAVQHKHQSERLQFNGMWFTPSFEPLLVSAMEIRERLDDRGHLRIIDRAKDVGKLADGPLFAHELDQQAGTRARVGLRP